MNNEGCQTNSNNTSITAKDVLETIKSAKEFLETNPGVINAANHVVQNGIKKGGYDIVRTAINGVLENGGEQGALNSTLNGLNNCYQGFGSLGEDFKQLGNSVVNRYKKDDTNSNSVQNQSYEDIVDCEYVQQEDNEEITEENFPDENGNLSMPCNMNSTN